MTYEKSLKLFDEMYPDGFDRERDMIEAMKHFSLFCGTCRHGNGCCHGVPCSETKVKYEETISTYRSPGSISANYNVAGSLR